MALFESIAVRNRLWTSLLFLAALLHTGSASERTALDEYIAKPDPHFSYKLIKTISGDDFTAYWLEMTSQQWLTTNEVDRPIWTHWLRIFTPHKLNSQTGLLFITGGSNDKAPPQKPDQNLTRMAVASGSVVTELRLVPNQPLTFKGETKGREEDALIAYTWDKYLRTGDERWPARLPMTKSATKAMDAITSFCASEPGGKITIDKFVVAGGSKRGWTTWSTAAVDKRVVAIVPIVIDLLNLVPSFKHHWAAYGFWAPAVHDYEEMGIMNWMDTPEYEALLKIEEPFNYRDRLTLPKYLINSTGDQFFLPDSAQFYFDQLLGEKYLRYVPNSDHSLKDTDALQSLLAFHDAILRGKQLPQFTWSSPRKDTFRIETKTKPAAVKLWQATATKSRDFRLETIGAAYTSTDLQPTEKGVYLAKVDPPKEGWTAFFVELTYDNEPAPFKFTTQVQVIPETLPYKDKPPTIVPQRGFLSGRSR